MTTEPHTTESADSQGLAYSQHIEELFELSTPAEMADHLWEMYSGFQYFDWDAGTNPRRLDIFYTFRELLYFCKKIEEMKIPGLQARNN